MILQKEIGIATWESPPSKRIVKMTVFPPLRNHQPFLPPLCRPLLCHHYHASLKPHIPSSVHHLAPPATNTLPHHVIKFRAYRFPRAPPPRTTTHRTKKRMTRKRMGYSTHIHALSGCAVKGLGASARLPPWRHLPPPNVRTPFSPLNRILLIKNLFYIQMLQRLVHSTRRTC